MRTAVGIIEGTLGEFALDYWRHVRRQRSMPDTSLDIEIHQRHANICLQYRALRVDCGCTHLLARDLTGDMFGIDPRFIDRILTYYAKEWTAV